MPEVTTPIESSQVKYYPNSADGQAGTEDVIKIPGIVNRIPNAETPLVADMRIMHIDVTGEGTMPQRFNVKHESIATVEGDEKEPYWSWE